MGPPRKSHRRPTHARDDALGHLRRRLRELVALESLQLAIAIGALLAIAVRAIVIAQDPTVAVSTTAVVLLALSCLLLALRVRAGQTPVRQELCAMEERQKLDDEARPLAHRSHPYRSSAIVPPGLTCRCGLSTTANELHSERTSATSAEKELS